MGFAVHWPGSPVASPRFHGVPRRDVPGRIHVSVTGELAGHAAEEGLTLAALRCDVPARAAALRRVCGWYLLDSTRCFILQSARQNSPTRSADAPVQPGFLRHVPARLINRSLRRPGHRLDPQVFDANYVKAPGNICAGLLHPVLATVGILRLQSRDLRLHLSAAIRSAPGSRQAPLESSKSDCLARCEVGAAQQFPGGQGCTDGYTTVNADDLSQSWTWNRLGDMGERDVPSPGVVPPYAVRFHPLGDGARQAEPHPSCLRDFDLSPVPIQPPHVALPDPDHPEPFVSASLAPRRTTAGAFEEVLHGPVMVSDRLLLNYHGPEGEPWVIRPGFGQLPTPLREPWHLAAPSAPLILLLHAQVPYVPSVPAVLQQHGLLFGSYMDTIPKHANIIAENTSQEVEIVINRLRCVQHA